MSVLRWAGRILAGLVFLFWGMFFVEHLQEWFIAPWPKTAPVAVWIGQGLHLAILVGLMLAIWKPFIGAPLAICASFAFFIDKAGASFPLFFGITALPAVLLLLSAWMQRRQRVSATGVSA